MRSALFVLVTVLAPGVVANAQSPGRQPVSSDCAADSTAPRDIDAIKKVILAWSKAYVAHDRQWFEQNYGAEISVNGQLRPREEEIRNLQDVESFEISDASLKIKFYGNVAIATGTERAVARNAQGQKSTEGRFTNVFVQCSGRWLVIADDWFPLK